MYLVINNELVKYKGDSNITGYKTVSDEVFNDYQLVPNSYKLENNDFIPLVDNSVIRKAKIRKRREQECFPIVNRGILWYNKLTEEQKNELNLWYTAWLDAPITDVIPEKPYFLNYM